MRALLVEKYGKKNSPVISEVPTPLYGPQDVLVRVSAAGFNPLDAKTRDGDFKQILPYKLPYIPGNDYAGVIEAVGDEVKDFAIGDEVFGMANAKRIGTFAELIAVHQSEVAHTPNGSSLADLSVLPLVALTAWQILTEVAKTKPGQKVLIHGGSGGLGITAIQIAKSLGLHVATTCGTRNLKFVETLGADQIIDYTKEDFEKVLSGFDLVIDSVGGKNLEKSMSVLKAGGLLVSLSGPADVTFAKKVGAPKPIQFVIKALSWSTLRKAKKFGINYKFHFVTSNGAQLAEIAKLVETGKLKPIVAQTLSLEDAVELFNSESTFAKVAGKTAIQIS